MYASLPEVTVTFRYNKMGKLLKSYSILRILSDCHLTIIAWITAWQTRCLAKSFMVYLWSIWGK